jgi:methyl-accepting chemotaxis protein
LQLDHQWIDAATAFAGLSGYTAVVVWLVRLEGKASQTSNGLADMRQDRERDNEAFHARLERAEQTAEAVRELAAAVRHGGEMTAAQIKNLADRFSEHAADTKEQLSEVKEEQRNVRIALARRQSRPRKSVQ